MKLFIKISLLVCLIIISFCSVAETESSFKDIMTDLDNAYFMHDTKRLELYLAKKQGDNINQNSEILKTISPKWRDYVEALVYYRLSSLALGKGDKEIADQHLDAALTLLAINNQDSLRAEFAAMRSSLLGIKIAIKFLRGMSLGGKADKALKFALSQSKNNAHVMLFQGIALFNKPAMFGGDKEKAIEVFMSAIDNFDPDVAPYWGAQDMTVWTIRALLAAEKLTLANDYFDKLLNIYPESPMVKSLAVKIKKLELKIAHK